MHDAAVKAFEGAMEHYSSYTKSGPNVSDFLSYTIHQDISLLGLPASVRFDAVVSPANSYAIMDGGFDDALSRAFSPTNDFGLLTETAQRTLWERNRRGYLPAGSCELVSMLPMKRSKDRYGAGVPVSQGRRDGGEGEEEEKEKTGEEEDDDDTLVHPWDCRYLALCPTMRVVRSCAWDVEIVYECIWSLLGAVERHNDDVRAGRAGPGARTITSILMTPLGTGFGGISYPRWARQAVLAMKHWVEAAARRDGTEKRICQWLDLARLDAEIKMTHNL